MSQLIDDLLLLARLDEERPLRVEPCSLDEVVQEAVEAGSAPRASLVTDAHPRGAVFEVRLPVATDGAGGRLSGELSADAGRTYSARRFSLMRGPGFAPGRSNRIVEGATR